jgi:hypothetical protein
MKRSEIEKAATTASREFYSAKDWHDLSRAKSYEIGFKDGAEWALNWCKENQFRSDINPARYFEIEEEDGK